MDLLLYSAQSDPDQTLEILGGRTRIALVTFAQVGIVNAVKTLKATQDFWAQHGCTVTAVRSAQDLANAQAIFVCGGNTFLLLKQLYEHSLLEPIRRLVRDGMPYIGISAGSNVAAPTIKTTNDMPIVSPPTLDALGLVDFQINPHYPDPDVPPTPLGQTRKERLREYVHENAIPVIGLKETSSLRVTDGAVTLLGDVTALLYRRGREPVEPVELAPGPVTIA